VLVSARSFAEYRAMFALTDDDLALRVLDCPGGAAAFVAGAGARGTDAVAVDPEYGREGHRLGGLALREIEHKHAEVAAHPERFVWSWFGDPDRYTRSRAEAARAFTADLARRPHRYVAGALPHLPFRDGAFDLVLSSHLLFCYGDRFGERVHRDALVELVRVTRREVRLYPLVPHTGGRRYAGLDGLRAHLAESGVGSRLERVDYAFLPGGDEMLVLDCGGRGPLAAAPPGARAVPDDPVRWRHRVPGS
jgi:SAM-dependent methyltransferase